MVKVRSLLMLGELVHESATRRHGLLTDVRCPIHSNRDFQTVPVNGGSFGQMILKDDPYVIALIRLNRRTRTASVVAPGVQGVERQNAALHGFRDQAEDLHAILDFIRKVWHIRCHDWKGNSWRRDLRRSSLLARRRLLAVLSVFHPGHVRHLWFLLRAEDFSRGQQSSSHSCRALKKPSSGFIHFPLLKSNLFSTMD